MNESTQEVNELDAPVWGVLMLDSDEVLIDRTYNEARSLAINYGTAAVITMDAIRRVLALEKP